MSRRGLPLSARLFLGFSLLVAGGGWFLIREAEEEVKPAVRQSTEETLVDTANLLAEILRKDVAQGTLTDGRWQEILRDYGKRRPAADIWGVEKLGVNHRVTVVDARGIVLLDSKGEHVGRDYSRWRDVYLTLRGKYGARSTESVPGDPRSTVMHVAAPIVDGGRIVGAVTVAKPNHTVQPFIARAEARLFGLGLGFIAVGLLLGAGLSLWLGRAVRELTRFAERVSSGERVAAPSLPEGELASLSRALEKMRAELDGHAYVERYVQTLTHELKGPLSGIRGAAELLEGELSPPQRRRLLDNISSEAERLHALLERLLHLAEVEKRAGLAEARPLRLEELTSEVLARLEPRLAQAGLRLRREHQGDATVSGEPFLLGQALENLLDNALAFASHGSELVVTTSVTADGVTLSVENEGPPIPDYALPRLTERFYSLPRPSTGRKGTGLGLAFVREVAELHGGRLIVENTPRGVLARLLLPQAPR